MTSAIFAPHFLEKRTRYREGAFENTIFSKVAQIETSKLLWIKRRKTGLENYAKIFCGSVRASEKIKS